MVEARNDLFGRASLWHDLHCFRESMFLSCFCFDTANSSVYNKSTCVAI